MGAERKLSSGIKTQVGLALELLDVILSKDIKQYVLPLIDENTSMKKRVDILRGPLELDNMGQSERLVEIITDRARWRSGWTRACAIYSAALAGLDDLLGEIESVLEITDHPVRETAFWAFYRLNPQIYRKYINEIRLDPNPLVSRLAQLDS